MRVEDQPAPIARTDREPVWPLVIENLPMVIEDLRSFHRPESIVVKVIDDMRERDRLGRERYGTPLTTGNGRNHLVDAYQEKLDAAVYLRSWIEENDVTPRTDEWVEVFALYTETLRAIVRLRWVIERSGGAP